MKLISFRSPANCKGEITVKSMSPKHYDKGFTHNEMKVVSSVPKDFLK